MTKGQKIGIGIAVFCGVSVLAAVVNPKTTTTTTSTPPASAAAPSPSKTAQAPATPIAKTAPAPGPTFVYPGDAECSITYASDASGGTMWIATTTVAGEILTHASDTSGNINSRDVQASVGQTSFSADSPLATINDIGGVLYVPNAANPTKTYGCSIAPKH